VKFIKTFVNFLTEKKEEKDFEDKIKGAEAAYERLMTVLNDRIGEEKTQEIAEEIKVSIKKEKDERQG